VVASQSTPFLAFKKWKMAFWCDEKENFLFQNCKPSQDAHVCIIWAHYRKLSRDSSNNIGRWAKSHETSNMIAHFEKVFL
jgi:hypothetical protein